MRKGGPICKSEGFEARSRVEVWQGKLCFIAVLNVVSSAVVAPGEEALSEAAWGPRDSADTDLVRIADPKPLQSLGTV